MASLLIGGSIEAIHRFKEKRAGKRRSTASSDHAPTEPATSHAQVSPQLPPPSFPEAELHHSDGRPSTAMQEKERMRQEDLLRAAEEGEEEHPAYRGDEAPPYEHPIDSETAHDAPPEYQAPPYERHRSDTLLESSRPRPQAQSRRTYGLFPRAPAMVGSNPITTNVDVSVSESSAAAREAERQGRKKCVVGPDGRCACGKRERSPGAPLGETIKERRQRKWQERFSVENPNFWGLVGVSLAR